MTIEQKRETWKKVRSLGQLAMEIKTSLAGEPGVGQAELFLDLAIMALGGAQGTLAKLWKNDSNESTNPERPGVEFGQTTDFK